MKKEYLRPQMRAIELKSKIQLLQASNRSYKVNNPEDDLDIGDALWHFSYLIGIIISDLYNNSKKDSVKAVFFFIIFTFW